MTNPTPAAALEQATNPALLPEQLNLPDNLTQQQWEELGQQIGELTAASMWWLGDWVNYGFTRYGTNPDGTPDSAGQAAVRQAIVANTRIDLSTIRDAQTVAAAFPADRRRNAPWVHHLAVLGDPTETQDRLLDLAEQQQLPLGELARTRKQLTATDTTGHDTPTPSRRVVLRCPGLTKPEIRRISETCAPIIQAAIDDLGLGDITVEFR